jgi:hypothetical protein
MKTEKERIEMKLNFNTPSIRFGNADKKPPSSTEDQDKGMPLGKAPQGNFTVTDSEEFRKFLGDASSDAFKRLAQPVKISEFTPEQLADLEKLKKSKNQTSEGTEN